VPVVPIGGHSRVGLWGRDMSLLQLGAKYAKTCNVSLPGVSVCQKGGLREASRHLEAKLHSIMECAPMVERKESKRMGGI
jgi:hypothetical protein